MFLRSPKLTHSFLKGRGSTNNSTDEYLFYSAVSEYYYYYYCY